MTFRKYTGKLAVSEPVRKETQPENKSFPTAHLGSQLVIFSELNERSDSCSNVMNGKSACVLHSPTPNIAWYCCTQNYSQISLQRSNAAFADKIHSRLAAK